MFNGVSQFSKIGCFSSFIWPLFFKFHSTVIFQILVYYYFSNFILPLFFKFYSTVIFQKFSARKISYLSLSQSFLQWRSILSQTPSRSSYSTSTSNSAMQIHTP
jgi:hypothetical protein